MTGTDSKSVGPCPSCGTDETEKDTEDTGICHDCGDRFSTRYDNGNDPMIPDGGVVAAESKNHQLSFGQRITITLASWCAVALALLALSSNQPIHATVWVFISILFHGLRHYVGTGTDQ